jgi:hypothetical protein
VNVEKKIVQVLLTSPLWAGFSTERIAEEKTITYCLKKGCKQLLFKDGVGIEFAEKRR